MNRLFTLSAALLVAAALSGCVYIDGENVGKDDWRDVQRDNREAISQLEIGTTRSAVLDRLGPPADSEGFSFDGEEIRVLFYRTTRKHSDGETTRDETTPLVFRNDQLEGWGYTLYDSYR